MIKTLALTPTTDPDTGWGRYSSDILSEFQKRDEYDVVVSESLGDPMKFNSVKSPMHIGRTLRLSNKLSKTIDKVKPDIVLSLIAHPYATAAYLATKGGNKVPYFVCCHGTYSVKPFHSGLSKKVCMRTFRNAERLFPVSSYTAQKIKALAPKLNNITVAQNGINLESFDQAEPFDVDHEVILTVGPFKQRKGQLLGVKAFSQISSQFENVEYHFIGNTGGEYYETVRQAVDEHGLSDKVHFEGYVSDEELQRWYATSSIYLFPAQYTERHHFEGFGLVLLEANLHHTPTIGTRSSGAIDAISDGKSGLLADPTAEDIATKLENVLEDHEYYQELSQNAVDWAKNHTWKETVDRMDSQIRKFVNKSKSL